MVSDGYTPRRVRLRDALASASAKRHYNREMFATIAPRYDLITRVLSYGQDQRWKDRVVSLAAPGPGHAALDVACGTGDLALRLEAAGARVTGLDLTPGMLSLARVKRPRSGIAWVAGDICALPLADGSFDLVTAGYGLRNLPDLDVGLLELRRVLRPGGRLVALDFNRPAFPPLREAYLGYLSVVGSALGLILHRDPDTYRYISASLRRYPGAPAVAARMRAAGFAAVTWHPVLGGLMAFHVADNGPAAVA